MPALRHRPGRPPGARLRREQPEDRRPAAGHQRRLGPGRLQRPTGRDNLRVPPRDRRLEVVPQGQAASRPASMDASVRRRTRAVAGILVEPAIGVRRRHAESGQRQHDVKGLPVRERVEICRRGPARARSRRSGRYGTSAPSAAPIAARSTRTPRGCQRCARAVSAEAASELPPPSPACIGMCLSIANGDAVRLAAPAERVHSARAARHTRLRSSVGTAGSLHVSAKGPGAATRRGCRAGPATGTRSGADGSFGRAGPTAASG